MRASALSLLTAAAFAIGVPAAVVAQRAGGAVAPAVARATYGRFAGFYKLIATDRRGYLAYDPTGYVSLTTQLSQNAARAPLAGYAAYFGTFAVDAAGTLTHQPFASLAPQLPSSDLVRGFAMSGNRLTLHSPAAGGSESGGVWERVPEPPNLTAAQRELIGFWRLVSTERRTTEGKLARAYPGWTGLIVYAPSGHMMVHMTEPYRRAFAGGEPTPEEATAALRSYTSYFGTYTITGPGTLLHHMEGSLNPGSVGTDTQRFFEVSGSKLILRPPLIKTPEGDVIMTNVWERVTD
jgi:hypothetical protein